MAGDIDQGSLRRASYEH